ncbi:MAG: hypothetical protein JWO92_1727 [Chitinophagaceae bacterium]|nr:hypothetical protein [Chitinophagaceae bacterium]
MHCFPVYVLTKALNMKKIFTIIAAASILAACNSQPDLETKKDVVLTDTTGMYKSNASTDISPVAADKEETAPVAPTKIIRETRVVYVDRTPKPTRQIVRQADPVAPVVTVPQPQTQTGTTTTNTGTGTTTDNSGVGTTTTGTGTGTTAPTTKPIEKDKGGWSNAAKGATIGGVGGAVVGAVISKKKGKGAIIGGILGAAGGYIFGKKKDKAEEANNNPQYTSY